MDVRMALGKARTISLVRMTMKPQDHQINVQRPQLSTRAAVMAWLEENSFRATT